MPSRHPKHAAHGGTYTAIPQEASKPFRDGGDSAEASMPLDFQHMPPSAADSDHMHSQNNRTANGAAPAMCNFSFLNPPLRLVRASFCTKLIGRDLSMIFGANLRTTAQQA